MKYRYSHLNDDEDEELAINQSDQEYDRNENYSPSDCDIANERWERQFLDNFYYR